MPVRDFSRELLDFWRRPVGFLADAYLNHGPLFRLEVPTIRMLMVGGEPARDAILELERQGESGAGCPMSRQGLFRPFATEVGLPVFDAEGENHKLLRHLIKMPYSRQLTAQFIPEINGIVADHVQAWQVGETCDLLKTTCELSLHAMMRVVTPVNLRTHAQAITKAGNRVMFAQFRILPESTLKAPDYISARNRMRAAVDEAIDRHAAGEFVNEAKLHIIDSCLKAVGPRGERMDKPTIRGICFYALAGTEIYMGRLSCFMIFELLKNRAFLERVLAEIDSTSESEDLANAFRRMPNLRAAYQETLRVYPLIPGYTYRATQSTTIAGCPIEKGEEITFAPYLGHFSAEHYADPTSFDPERHSQTRREFARSHLFVPFGVGRHACAATGLVEVMVLSIVTAILRRVDLRLTQPTLPISLRLKPLISPATPIRIRLESIRQPKLRVNENSHLAETADFHEGQSAPDWLAVLPELELTLVRSGELIIEQGDRADAFYVVVEGEFSVQIRGPERAEFTEVACKEPGSCFGEVGLFKKAPRNARVVAKVESKVIRFSQELFETLVGTHDLSADDIRCLYYTRYIRAALKDQLIGLHDALTPDLVTWRNIEAGDYMFRQGEPSDAFYVIVQGQADVIVRNGETSTTVAQLHPGQFFGEIGILKNQARAASVIARTPLKTLRMERENLIRTLQSHPRALSDLALITCQRLLAQVQHAD